jgi:sortase A
LISPHFPIHNENVRTNRIARLVLAAVSILGTLVVPTVGAQATTSSSIPAINALPKPGSLVATVYIPRLRNRVWGKKVVEDTTARQLAMGFGHYQGTAMPGQLGNFVIAAHRRGPVAPLYDIDHLRKGDRVIIHQARKWYIYTLTTSMVVKPSAMWILSPAPRNVIKAGTAPRPIITMQTCTPAATSTHRWIWWGVLSKVITSSTMPTLR